MTTRPPPYFEFAVPEYLLDLRLVDTQLSEIVMFQNETNMPANPTFYWYYNDSLIYTSLFNNASFNMLMHPGDRFAVYMQTPCQE